MSLIQAYPSFAMCGGVSKANGVHVCSVVGDYSMHTPASALFLNVMIKTNHNSSTHCWVGFAEGIWAEQGDKVVRFEAFLSPEFIKTYSTTMINKDF